MVGYHYTNLHVFHSADTLVHTIFDLTLHFPKSEIFNTTSQIRRAALSVVLNIVEGNAKRFSSTKEFLRFLYIAYGSLMEVEYLLDFSLKRKFLSTEQFEHAKKTHTLCSKELWLLCRYQEQRKF